MRYVVTAPYITVRVPDVGGKWTLRGFHVGVQLPEGTNEDDIAKHIRKTMIAPVEEPVVVEEPAPKPTRAAK